LVAFRTAQIDDRQTVEADQLMAMGGDAVAAILAAGCGYPRDEKAESIAERLAIDAQANLIATIMRLTLPAGLGPFVEKLTRDRRLALFRGAQTQARGD
jgi:hypothetical protein